MVSFEVRLWEIEEKDENDEYIDKIFWEIKHREKEKRLEKELEN